VGVFDELVHQPAIEGLLLCRVAVIHVAGRDLARRQAERVGGVGIVGQERLRQAIDGRRARRGVKGRLARQVQRHGIGGEIVIEGDVLLKQHDDMLDRRPGRGLLRRVAGSGRDAENERRTDDGGQKPGHGSLLSGAKARAQSAASAASIAAKVAGPTLPSTSSPCCA